ncbi:hypothetical protein NL108_007806 [Boleophthalmus pectinirostris]|nr:hypothetical protein NL108_007806 [Boleophthalmus pectinirostris]
MDSPNYLNVHHFPVTSRAATPEPPAKLTLSVSVSQTDVCQSQRRGGAKRRRSEKRRGEEEEEEEEERGGRGGGARRKRRRSEEEGGGARRKRRRFSLTHTWVCAQTFSEQFL